MEGDKTLSETCIRGTFKGHLPWKPSHSPDICLLTFRIFSMCVDLCKDVPLRCRNFDTRPTCRQTQGKYYTHYI